MRVAERIHIVGSGKAGFNLTDDYDCHVYLVDGGSEHALIDAGGGRDVDGIERLLVEDGIDVRRVKHLLVTHAHADHAAGAAEMRKRFGVSVWASADVSRILEAGDARGASLDVAKRAGGYPADFAYPACPVDGVVADGMAVRVGEVELGVVETAGHAAGHVSYVLRRDGKTSVFCGDAFFFGGRILLQDTWDCSVGDSIRAVERLASLSVDGLYPGHLTFAVRNGRREVAKAMEYVSRLVPPPQLL